MPDRISRRHSFCCLWPWMAASVQSYCAPQNTLLCLPSLIAVAILLGIGSQGVQGQGFAADRALPSTGNYLDKRSGTKHAWQVTETHALLWDNNPYMPVGAVFTPQSFQNESPSAWDHDRDALENLKAHGILDLLIRPDRSLPQVPIAALERLIATLEAGKFRYGLAFGPGIGTPTSGFVVRPSLYRFEDVGQLTAVWQVKDTEAAAYFIADAGRNSTMLHAGMATVREGVATAPLDNTLSAARPVALLLPRETTQTNAETVLPDLWGHYDTYRDQLLTVLSKIKLGPGLRFFLDPLARRLALSEETSYLVPDSEAFRIEWETFLTRRYGNPQDLQEKWKLSESFGSISEMARLVPLWSRDRGFPYCYDPSTGKTYRTDQSDTLHSLWWDDFTEFRAEGIRYCMNSLADLLKHRVADVPVVYSSLPGNRTFAFSDSSGGFDGLSISTQIGEPSMLARTSGPTFSLAERSYRRTWLFAAEMKASSAVPPAVPTKDLTSDVKAARGTKEVTQDRLSADLMNLRKLGFKGFFVEDPPVDSTIAQAQPAWLSQGTNLDWLHTYSAAYSADLAASRYKPTYLYYPESAPGPAHTSLVPGSAEVYWLPTDLPGRAVDQWPTLSGYELRRTETQVDTVLVSLQGPRKIRFVGPSIDKMTASTPDGQPILLKKIGKTAVEVNFGSEPIVFQTGGQEIVAIQSAFDGLVQLAYLVQRSKEEKTQTADYGNMEFDQAVHFYNDHNYGGAYASARSVIDNLSYDVAPYIWLEGELPAGHNFTEVAANSEASRGAFLRLSTPNPSRRIAHYGVRYLLNVPNNDLYDIWLAGTPPGPEVSPFSWYIDSQPEQDPVDPHPQGPLYLNDRFGWIRLGSIQLTKGQHTFSLKVLDRAAASHIYSFSIDSLVIIPSSRGFQPNGTTRPILVAPKLAEKAFKLSLKAAP